MLINIVIKSHISHYPHPRLNWLVQRLQKQISLDYQRAHNRITFDKVSQSLPGYFAYVNTPEVPDICKSVARVDVPKYPFHKQFDSFIFNSFLTRPEAIIALGDVRAECNKVRFRPGVLVG